MSELKPTPTPGPWTQGTSANGRKCVWLDGKTEPAYSMGPHSQWIDCETAANARLIAEAGTVFHETGLSPRQLAERNAELIALLQQVQDAAIEMRGCDFNLSPDWWAKFHAALAKCQPKPQEGQT